MVFSCFNVTMLQTWYVQHISFCFTFLLDWESCFWWINIYYLLTFVSLEFHPKNWITMSMAPFKIQTSTNVCLHEDYSTLWISELEFSEFATKTKTKLKCKNNVFSIHLLQSIPTLDTPQLNGALCDADVAMDMVFDSAELILDALRICISTEIKRYKRLIELKPWWTTISHLHQ